MKMRLPFQVLSRICNNTVIDYISGYSGTIIFTTSKIMCIPKGEKPSLPPKLFMNVKFYLFQQITETLNEVASKIVFLFSFSSYQSND
jgi:hypothetical protein